MYTTRQPIDPQRVMPPEPHHYRARAALDNITTFTAAHPELSFEDTYNLIAAILIVQPTFYVLKAVLKKYAHRGEFQLMSFRLPPAMLEYALSHGMGDLPLLFAEYGPVTNRALEIAVRMNASKFFIKHSADVYPTLDNCVAWLRLAKERKYRKLYEPLEDLIAAHNEDMEDKRATALDWSF